MPLIVFDIDGTLTDTSGVDDECFCLAVASALGVAVTDTDWSRFEAVTDPGLARALALEAGRGPPSATELARARAGLIEALETRAARQPWRFASVPGAGDVLRGLAGRGGRGEHGGCVVAIATGAWEGSARVKLGASGLLSLEPLGGGEVAMASGDDAASRPEIVATAARRAMGIDGPAVGSIGEAVAVCKLAAERFGGVVCVGDGVWDARAARRLGVGFVGVRVGGDFDRLRAEGARSLLRDYADTPAAMEVILSAVAPGRAGECG